MAVGRRSDIISRLGSCGKSHPYSRFADTQAEKPDDRSPGKGEGQKAHKQPETQNGSYTL